MYRYTIRFAARSSLEEGRLRDILKRKFSASGVVIMRGGSASRIGRGVAAQPKSQVEEIILECIKDCRPWRRKTLIERAAIIAPANVVVRALFRLERNGAIRKVRHGVLISADALEDAAAEIPPLNNDANRPTHEEALELLRVPRSAGELSKLLEVSRQRIDHLLIKMMREGQVRRFKAEGEKVAYLYAHSDLGEDSLRARVPTLRSPRQHLLSALPHAAVCRSADLAREILASRGKLRIYLDQLDRLRLLTTFKLVRHTYVGITQRGLDHPEYEPSSPKCQPADILAEFGEARVKYIQNLDKLGAARTIDLTHAMPIGYFAGKARGPGHIMQELEKAGIVERSQAQGGKQPSYSLTAKGLFISTLLARVNTPPSVEQLRTTIAERRRKISPMPDASGTLDDVKLGRGSERH